MADRHRWVGFVAAVTAAGAFAALWVPNLGSRVATGATGTSYLLIGLALSGLLAAATLTRRGVLMGGAALLVAVGPWGPEFFIQILFFVYAVFLMVMVARQTRPTGTSSAANRVSSWLSGLRLRLAPSPAPAAGTVRPRPASSARYTAPQRRRK